MDVDEAVELPIDGELDLHTFAPHEVKELVAQSLELSPANVREIHARWARCRSLIEINGNLQLTANPLAKLLRENHAVFHRRTFERNERNDIRRADTRMLSLMLPQIDM